MNYLKKLNPKLLLALCIAASLSLACGSDDPEPPNEEELITTVNVTFTNNGQTDEAVTGTFRDIDGPGGEAPTITGVQLSANSSYTVTVEFLNESETPAEDVTAEVREEDLDHQVFFVIGGNIGITYSYGDQDSQGNPLGLTGTLTTTVAGNADIQVVLVHEPVKSNVGVADGNLANAGGEEDIRVQIPVVVQ